MFVTYTCSLHALMMTYSWRRIVSLDGIPFPDNALKTDGICIYTADACTSYLILIELIDLQVCHTWQPPCLTEHGYRPNAQPNYEAMFKIYLGFYILSGSLSNLTTGMVMAFMEFVFSNDYSYSAVANHIFAVISMLGLYSFPNVIFETKKNPTKLKLFLELLQINNPISVFQLAILDITILHKITALCDKPLLVPLPTSNLIAPVFYIFYSCEES